MRVVKHEEGLDFTRFQEVAVTQMESFSAPICMFSYLN